MKIMRGLNQDNVAYAVRNALLFYTLTQYLLHVLYFYVHQDQTLLFAAFD